MYFPCFQPCSLPQNAASSHPFSHPSHSLSFRNITCIFPDFVPQWPGSVLVQELWQVNPGEPCSAAEDVSRSSCLHTTLLKVTVITIQQNQHRTSACKLVIPMQSHPADRLSQSAMLCTRMDKVYVCNSSSADSAEGNMSRNRKILQPHRYT